MIAPCPVCGTLNDSDDHDVGWYFVCNGCCPYRLVWVELAEGSGLLRLEVVPEDQI